MERNTVRLIRGWEKQHLPETTGGLRLSKASLYRAIGEEEGLGDRREGEVRVRSEGKVEVEWEPVEVISPRALKENSEREAAESQQQMREALAAKLDDPELELEALGLDHWKLLGNTKIDDTQLGSPYLFCLSREPATRADWERLRTALPRRYDTWRVTDAEDALNFEIECGIRRWMRLNRITQHRIERGRGWIQYSYDTAPPSGEPDLAGHISKWFRKRRMYMNQQEYRFAWNLRSPQRENMPETIDIELTRTGLGLFKPWTPPS